MKENKENLPEVFDPKSLLEDNMAGVTPQIPVIGIIHQAQSFKMQDGTKVDTISGVVLDIHNARSYWDTPFDQGTGDDAPDCYSNDGIKPAQDVETPFGSSCASCEKGKYDEGIKKTPCKRTKQMHILMDGDIMPIRLPAPPSNIRVVDSWIQGLTSKGIPYQMMPVTIGLKATKNKGGIEYSELTFLNGEVVSDENGIKNIMGMRTGLLPQMRRENGHFED